MAARGAKQSEGMRIMRMNYFLWWSVCVLGVLLACPILCAAAPPPIIDIPERALE